MSFVFFGVALSCRQANIDLVSSTSHIIPPTAMFVRTDLKPTDLCRVLPRTA